MTSAEAALFSACHGAGTIIDSFADRGISTDDPLGRTTLRFRYDDAAPRVVHHLDDRGVDEALSILVRNGLVRPVARMRPSGGAELMSAQTVTLSTLSTLPNLMAGTGSFASETVLDASLRSLTAGGWAVVLPEDSAVLGMPRGPGAARRLRRALQPLVSGSPVAVISRMPIAAGRVARVAARSGLVVQRQLVALPRLGGTCYLVEDDPVRRSVAAVVRAHVATRSQPGSGAAAAGDPAGSGPGAGPCRVLCAAASGGAGGAGMTSPTAPRPREPLVGATPLGSMPLLSEPDSRIALLAVSKDENAKVTLMVFGGGSDGPDLAVKMPTTDAAGRVIEREARILVDLRRLRLPIFDRTVPRFVQTVEQRGRLASVVTALPGVPMSTRYHDWHHTARESLVRRDFALAGSAGCRKCRRRRAGTARIPSTWRHAGPSDIHERWSDEPDIEWLIETAGGVAGRALAACRRRAR